jgi:hypothetical protein
MCSEYLFLTSETVFILIIISLSGGVFSFTKVLSRSLGELRFKYSLEDMYVFSKAYQAFDYYRMLSIIMCFLGVWFFSLGFWVFFILLFIYLLYIEYNMRKFMNYFSWVVLVCLSLIGCWRFGCLIYNFSEIYSALDLVPESILDSSESIIGINDGMQVYFSGGEKSAYKCYYALRAAANTSISSEVLSWCLHKSVSGQDGRLIAFMLNNLLPKIYCVAHSTPVIMEEAESIAESHGLGEIVKEKVIDRKDVNKASLIVLSHKFGQGADRVMPIKSDPFCWARFNLIKYKNPVTLSDSMQIQESLPLMRLAQSWGLSDITRTDIEHQGDFFAKVHGSRFACEIKTPVSELHEGKLETIWIKYKEGKLLSGLDPGLKRLALIDAGNKNLDLVDSFRSSLIDQIAKPVYKDSVALVRSSADISQLGNKLGLAVIHDLDFKTLPCPSLESANLREAEDFEGKVLQSWDVFDKKDLLAKCFDDPSSIKKEVSIEILEAIKTLRK